jgi:hypothetical protein
MTVISSFAWLTASRDLDANNIGMGLAIDDTSAVYNVYMYDLVNQVGIDKIKVSGEGEPEKFEELNLFNLTMNQYDTIFSVQNKFTPAFAQIEITRVSSMPTSGTVYITIDRDTAVDAMTKDNQLTQNVSSVLRFTAIIDHTQGDLAITDPNELYSYINPESVFNVIRDYTGDKNHSKTFTAHGTDSAQDGHGHTKVDKITIAIDYSDTDWYKKDGFDTLNVYLYISYDTEKLQCFLKEHSGDKISFDNTEYIFANDLKKVTVSYEKPTD